MFEMNTNPYSKIVARYYAKLLVTTGKGAKYAPDYQKMITLKDILTHSKTRFLTSKYIFINYPVLVLGGPIARWVHESHKAAQKIDRLLVETPVLILQAGLDKVVKLARQESYCKKGICEFVNYPEAFHEIRMEKDSIRDEALNEIKLFFGM